MHRTPAARRYLRRFSIVTAIYIALVAANMAATHVFAPPLEVEAALAVIAALPIIAMLMVLGLYLREETDEFVRDRLILSMFIGLGVLLSLSSLLGMLQFSGVVGSLPVFLAFPIWCGAWGIAQTVLAWRDRRTQAQS